MALWPAQQACQLAAAAIAAAAMLLRQRDEQRVQAAAVCRRHGRLALRLQHLCRAAAGGSLRGERAPLCSWT